jgi:acyl-CoA synthetase (AMP-forming)/AMP-acid ligase II
MFTSGSEGAPKSVERSHKSWVKSFDNSELEFGLNQDTTSLVPGPLSHGVALFGLLSGLYFGRTVVIQTKFDTKKILRVCESINSVSLVIVPSMVDLIIGVASEITYSSVKQIVSGGAKLLPVVRDRARRAFPEADIIEYYGASELSFVTVSKETEACPVESVGRVFIGAKLEVRDVTGNILDTGSAGEIWVKSDMLCTPSITPELSTGFSMEDGWATVRDLGFLNSEGFLFLQGRAGSVISTGGYIVYPLSVEKVLSNHPAIEDVTVFGFQDIRWGELVCAAIVLGDTKKPTQNELYHFCLQELEPYSCPRKWVFLDSIDKLSNGKINMSALHKYIT